MALVGEDLVLLDLKNDAYLCIPEGRRRLQPCLDSARLRPVDEAAAEELRRAGLLVSTPDRNRVPPPPSLPQADLGHVQAHALSLTLALRLAACLWDLFWRYRNRTLGEIVAFAASSTPAADLPVEELLRLARLFQRAVIWLPISRKCLVRSFVLLRFLQRSGHNARWVFGVRTWPFSAHCWLQSGEVVLDDHPERLSGFSPIFAVG